MTDAELSILSPVSLATFFASYWEQQPLHIERSAAMASVSLIDLPAIETLLSTQPVYFPGVQLTQSGKTIDVASYTDEQSMILPSRLFEYHADGATVVLSQAQKLVCTIGATVQRGGAHPEDALPDQYLRFATWKQRLQRAL